MTEVTRHFTATTFVIYQDRVLLHFHKKLAVWLPVGGHIDRDELPEQAAIREVWEEAGLAVSLYRPDSQISFSDGATHLHRPVHLLLEEINPFHQHIDFIYYAVADGELLTPARGESDRLRWFTQQELEIGAWLMPANARVLALEALTILGKPARQ
jgi:8-oxo-dGTP pyrophosphatase MutT (NUDIX family)